MDIQIHGYNEYGHIKATIDGVYMTVPDDMAVWHRKLIYEEWEKGTKRVIPAYIAPAFPYKLYKSKFIERMTNEEAKVLEEVLNFEEAKLRLMFNSVDYFVSNDPLFAVIHNTLSTVLNEDRANELLREEDGE